MCALIASVRAKLPALSDPAKTKKHRLMPVLFSCPSVWAMVYCIHISSRNTTSAVGRYPSTARSYLSDSFRRLMLTGPKISSGVEKRDIRYSNALASTKALFNRRATIDFATPGGPSNKILSPAKAASKDKPISASFSYTPLFISDSSNCIRSFISILFFDSAHK